MKIADLYKLYAKNFLVDTDSRSIRKGSIFFALSGPNFNGNKFAEDALKKGADYAVIDDEKFNTSNKTILVQNVLETLQKLANYHRKKLNIPIIALTGSNGKTTTKELINGILSKKYNTVATKGNLNNHIGVPLTLLSMTSATEIGIVEMGANHLNEISFLCKMAEPNYGYITNFGKAHLEGFGSIEGVIKGKSELYNYIKNTNGSVFLNTDDSIQVSRSKGIKSISFNKESIPFLGANPLVTIQFKNQLIRSMLVGAYNYSNIASAVVIGNYFNVSVTAIKEAVESYEPKNNRSQIITKGDTKIILDAYNANPTSMEAALKNFAALKEENKIVFLGDMFELGSSSGYEHQKIAELATSFDFNKIYLIGKAFSTTRVKNALHFDSFESLKNSNPHINTNKTTVLIKGSRGMALERILNLF